MRRARNPWLNHRRILLCLVLSVIGVAAANAGGASKGGRSSPAPDGACYPVQGTGYMVTRGNGLRIPIGTLSPLIEGDSLVVQTGTITFVDFRTGQSPVYGAGTRLEIPPVKRPKRPPWWKRLEDHLVLSLSQPERDRIGGSVRGGGPTFWPDSARFAPEVPVVFEWSGVHPAPVFLRVFAGGDTTECEVSRKSPDQGVLAWRPPVPIPAGRADWVLLDADRELLGGGHFVILTTDAADAERRRFLSAAGGMEPLGLTAAVLAQVDHVYLW